MQANQGQRPHQYQYGQAQGLERAQPVLGTQPPLPGQATVRYVQPEDIITETAMVPMTYYKEEIDQMGAMTTTNTPSELGGVPEGNYQMDHNTLWFIANGGARQALPGIRPYPPRVIPMGTCYRCKGDHYVRDCPELKADVQPSADRATGVAPLARFCLECRIKHIVQDYPINPDNKGKKSITLNMVEVLNLEGSPNTSEAEQTVPFQAMTRAQAQAQQETEVGDIAASEITKSPFKSWRARRARRAAAKKKRAAQANENKTDNQNDETKPEPEEKKSEEKGGSVLADKHFEPLKGLLQAYEARLKPLENLEERWRKYPDPVQEARQLEIYKRLIQATQALTDQLKQNENSISQTKQKGNKKKKSQPENGNDEISIESQEETERKTNSIHERMLNVPEVDEDWGNRLWEAINKKKQMQEEAENLPWSRLILILKR